MKCFSCGEENPDDAKSCIHCGEWLAGDQPPPPRTSFLAMLSLILAAAGVFTLGITTIPGLIVGSIALIQIRRSRRNLKGMPYAVGGIALSCLILYGLLTAPLRNSTRPFARRAACKNNLKQIGLALQLYSTDYDNQFPPGGTAVEVFSALTADITGRPYLKYTDIFLCPAAKADLESWDRLGKLTEETVSYEWVPGLSPDSNPDFILAYDKSPDHHDGGRNVLYVDGRVDFMPEEAFQAEMARQRQLMEPSE